MKKGINTGIQGVSSDSVVACYKPTDAEVIRLGNRALTCRSCSNTGIGMGGRRCLCLGDKMKKRPTLPQEYPEILEILTSLDVKIMTLATSRNKWAKMAWERKTKIRELEALILRIEEALEKRGIDLDPETPSEELTECGHPRAQVEASQQMRNGPPGVGDVVWACYCPTCKEEWDE